MIYLSITHTVIPGKMAEYSEMVKELPPVYARNGMKMVGSWHGYTGNINEIYNLYVFNDLAELQKVRAAMQADKDYQRISARLNALRNRSSYVILEPNAWSPMK
jgi:hypothetical protein